MLSNEEKAVILNAVNEHYDSVLVTIDRAVRAAITGGTGAGKAQIVTALAGGAGLYFCEDDRDAMRADDEDVGLEIVRIENWIGFDSSVGNRYARLIAQGKFNAECVAWTYDRALTMCPVLAPEIILERFLARIRATMRNPDRYRGAVDWRSKASMSKLVSRAVTESEKKPELPPVQVKVIKPKKREKASAV